VIDMPDTLVSLCNTCFRETNHKVLHYGESDEVQLNPSSSTYHYVLTCRGCNTASIRYEAIDSGSGLATVHYEPQRLWVKPPAWIEQIEAIDQPLADLLLEVYSAANSQQSRLLAMGVRTVLDHVMIRIIGDRGSFDIKLKEMVDRGLITGSQQDALAIVIDAGSACAHRGFKPPRELLEQMISVMESIIREYYITAPMLSSLKSRIPPRPPRIKSALTNSPQSAKDTQKASINGEKSLPRKN
jgi:hypothetical protein